VALFVCFVVFAAFVAGAPQKETVPAPDPADSTYTTKYDKIDVDQVLSSRRLVSNYVQCLLDKKPCTPEGTELRKLLPDAMKTQCSKCSATQKNAALRVMDRLQTEYVKEWQQLLDKWDPKRELNAKFEEYMKEEKEKGFTKF